MQPQKKKKEIQKEKDEGKAGAERVEMLSGDQRFHLSRGPIRIVNSWWPDLKRFQCISRRRKDIKEEIKPWNNLIRHAAGFPMHTEKLHACTSLKCSHAKLNKQEHSA